MQSGKRRKVGIDVSADCDQRVAPLRGAVGDKAQALLQRLEPICSEGLVSADDAQELYGALQELEDSIHELNLQNSDLSKLPAELANLRNLEVLDLTGNWLGAGTLEGLADLQSLRRLVLYGNAIRQLPPSLAALTRLEELDLGNNLIEALPPADVLAPLTALRRLDLNSNPLRSAQGIGALRGLRQLDLSFGDLAELPDELGALQQLETLDLASNALTLLPCSLGNLTSLRTLDLTDNPLEKDSAEVLLHWFCTTPRCKTDREEQERLIGRLAALRVPTPIAKLYGGAVQQAAQQAAPTPYGGRGDGELRALLRAMQYCDALQRGGAARQRWLATYLAQALDLDMPPLEALLQTRPTPALEGPLFEEADMLEA